MAYSRAYVRSFAKDASLTIDHDLYTTMLLTDLPTLLVPEIPTIDLSNTQEREVHENFKIPFAAARYLQRICCTAPQLETCCNESELQQPSKLELPLLKTDPEEDLREFKNNRKYQQIQHFKTLKAIDINFIDQSLLGMRTATITDPRHSQGIARFSCIVPQPARDLLKSIISAENVSWTELQSASAMETLDPFYSDRPLSPFQEPEPAPVCDSSLPRTSSVANLNCRTESIEVIEIDHKGGLPGDAEDNPYIIDPLENQFARISVTPEVVMRPVVNKGHRKLSSPLTPPNTIRSYRKNIGKNSKKTAQPNSLSIAQSKAAYSSNHDNVADTSLSQETRSVTKERILSGRPPTSKIMQKIELANLPQAQVSGFKSFTTDFNIQASFKQDIQKALGNHRLPDPNIKDWEWAPWVPFQFDEDAFRSRFDALLGGEFVHSFKIPQPIDPRTLLTFVSIDRECLEELKPMKLTRPWDSSLLPRKRKLDTVDRLGDCENHPLVNSDKVQTFDTLENSFPGMAFELLANGSAQIKKSIVTTATRSVSVNVQPPDKGFITLQTLVPSVAPPPQDIFPSRDFHLIATSCGVMTRQAIRSIRCILQEVQIIERDFMASWTSKDNIPSDADIILSPQTGIVLATIGEMQQQPLPGTVGISRFRRKIVTLASKFEKLYVLARTNNDGDRNVLLESRDFTEQHGLVSGTIIHVEDFHGKEALYLRIANLVVQEHVQLLSLDLYEEETYWEYYLRREIGMNAYAAQIVLQKSWMKTIHGQEESPSTLRYLNKDKCVQELSAILGEKSSKLLSAGLSGFEDARVDVPFNVCR